MSEETTNPLQELIDSIRDIDNELGVLHKAMEKLRQRSAGVRARFRDPRYWRQAG